MSNVQLSNQIDCSNLSSEEINYNVKDLIFNNYKHIVLKNVHGKKGLLEGLKGNIKIEIIGDVDSLFANSIDGAKIIVNGNIGDNSAGGVKSGKFTLFGSSGNYFGNNVDSGEFYILENCGRNSFSKLTNLSKVVIGGYPGINFGESSKGGRIIILNLKGGNFFIDNETKFFENSRIDSIYVRGNIKINNNKFLIENIIEEDEDIYLPLISEFARLFSYSLSEIKSKPFYRIVFSDKR